MGLIGADRTRCCIGSDPGSDANIRSWPTTCSVRRRRLFPESKILHWFVQIALGLHYMHGQRVLHRDLKTQNIFLLGNGRLVLGDLGISKVCGIGILPTARGHPRLTV